MWHTVFIAVHAAAGLIAFGAGCVAIRRGGLFWTYLWSLVAMELFLVLAIAAEWTLIDAFTRLLFGALAALGLIMVWQADQARRNRPSGSPEQWARYVAGVGFTLVALVDAFVVVTVLNAGAPGWSVAVVGVAIGVVGHLKLRAVRGPVGRHPVTALAS